MAISKQAAWGVLPCCVRNGLYLGKSCSIYVTEDERDVRHALMCGSIAEKYNAQLIQEIDRRITNRAIFIGGGVTCEVKPSASIATPAREKYANGELSKTAHRKTLPRLLMS